MYMYMYMYLSLSTLYIAECVAASSKRTGPSARNVLRTRCGGVGVLPSRILCTPNLPSKIVPSKMCWLEISWKSQVGLGIPHP